MEFDKKISKIKLILTSFCCLLGLSCFCSANLSGYDYSFSGLLNFYSNACTNSQTFSANSSVSFAMLSYCSMSNDSRYTYQSADSIYDSCVYYSGYNSDLYVYRCNSSTFSTTDCENLGNFSQSNSNNTYCWTSLSNDSSYYFFYNSSSSSLSIKKADIKAFSYNHNVKSSLSPACPSCPSCPSQYTSLECQQEYSLIPVSSVDSYYCESNNLCSSSDCSINTGDFNRSALYINNIQHLGGAIIRIDIPEEIDRDYTQGTGEFDLDVVGYNVDYEAIQNKIDIQNYKPSQEDFNNVIGVLAGYMPLIVILIGFVVILSLIKKPFKSKL